MTEGPPGKHAKGCIKNADGAWKIVARCAKCGREFISIPDKVLTDAYLPYGSRNYGGEVCGGRIIRESLNA